MKKIEEYETKDTAGRSPEEIFVEECIANKLNEVIFRLNQSVSQPEVDVVKAFEEMEEIENMTPEEFNKSKYAKREVENNTEEWEQNLVDRWYLFDYDTDLKTYTTCENEIIAFIQQLLSERSFSKEELEIIKEQVISASVDRKVDRLLSLESN